MGEEVVKQSSFLDPGHVYLPSTPTQLCAVAGFGVVVTLFDRARRLGGMCHYLYPKRKNKTDSTALYAGPAIVSLARMLTDTGSRNRDIEAQLFGGGKSNQVPPGKNFGERNIKAAREILQILGISICGEDVGGNRGRKIVFTSDSGETAVLKVNRIRSGDWTGDPNDRRRRGRGHGRA